MPNTAIKVNHITKDDTTVSTYNDLITSIGTLLQTGRKKAYKEVENILLITYWNVGKYLIEFEQNGYERAEYGKNLLINLSKDLKIQYGKGFSRSNLDNKLRVNLL